MNSESGRGKCSSLGSVAKLPFILAFHGRHSSLFIRHCLLTAAILIALLVPNALADELTLKDGHKISGTIVGFENGMFRLQTEYGFELVRKDKVASIKITESAEKEVSSKTEANKKSEASPAERNGANASATGEASAARIAKPAAPPPPPVSHLVDDPLPAHIEQHEDGSEYVNDTFHFSMFKPPGWKIFEELPRGKVSAIVALGSEDEQTLLFVDHQLWSGEPDLKNDAVENHLRQIYEDYKKLSEADTQVDGRPAIRRTFTGIMDGVEWHGVVVRVAQGSAVFGIIEMTSAEGYQFQEAVFNKIVKTFHFLNATPGGPADGAHNSASN